MAAFFKNFGKGILYVLILPLLLVCLAVYLVVSLFMFLILGIKGLILFFSGRSLYDDLPEDIEAKRRINEAITNNNIEKNRQMNLNVDVNKVLMEQQSPLPISTDPFYCPDYLKEENKNLIEEPAVENEYIEEAKEELQVPENKAPINQEAVFKEEPPQEEVFVEEPPMENIELENEIILPKIDKPQENYEDEIMDEKEENETSSGVDIFY